MPGESHGGRSQVGYSPWGRKESDTTERLHFLSFKKIRDTKGIFHAKMGTIKDRNGIDLTEAEDIKKRWPNYTEELYKKDP